MANPYSKYTGARVQPVPAGFIQAYGKVGEMYSKGIAGLGEGIGDAIEKYYEGQEERATLSGKGEGFVEAAEAYPGLYGSLLTDETKKKLQGMPDMGLNQLRQFIGKLDAQKALLEKGETFKLKRDALDSDKKTAAATAARAEKTFGLSKEKFAYQRDQDAIEWANKTDKEKEVEARRVGDLQAALVSKGVVRQPEMVIGGYYLPAEGITVSPDDPRGKFSPLSVPEFAPTGEGFYPAVQAGKVPLGLAKAMGAASTSTLALKLWDDYEAEQWKQGASEREIKKTEALRQIPAAGNLLLSKLALQFKNAESPEEKRRLGSQAALVIMNQPGIKLLAPFSAEDGEKYLSNSVFPEQGVPGVPTETAEERGRRNTYMSVLKRLDQLVEESEGNDWTGMLPSFKAKIEDELLPKLGIDKHANWERMEFRATAGITAWNIIRSLNEEGRLSDKDAERIEPLVPSKDDDFPIFRSKLKAIKSIIIDKLQLQNAGAGREDVFSLAPVDFFKKLGKPDEDLGGVTPIPTAFAPSVIKSMPQFKYIGGDKSKPVTADYIAKLAKDGKITPEAALLWIKHTGVSLPKK